MMEVEAYRQLNKRIKAKMTAIPASTHRPQKYQPLLRRHPIPSKKYPYPQPSSLAKMSTVGAMAKQGRGKM